MFRAADAGLKSMCNLRLLRRLCFLKYPTRVNDCHLINGWGGRLCRLGLDEFGASAYHLLVVDDLSFLSGNDCIKKIVREFDHLFEIARMGNYARRVLEERHNLAKIY